MILEYIDGNTILNVSKKIIEKWIHKLEGDLSILYSELLRRESGISYYDFDVFNRKDDRCNR